MSNAVLDWLVAAGLLAAVTVVLAWDRRASRQKREADDNEQMRRALRKHPANGVER